MKQLEQILRGTGNYEVKTTSLSTNSYNHFKSIYASDESKK